MERKRICVIGAGTMGSGIAAHLANIGHEVTLLDRTRQEAQAAMERAKRARPPHFRLEGTAETIRLGGTDQDLDAVKTADWVCEAVVEKPGVKKAIFSLIEPLLGPEAMISTNTSGLEIGTLAEGRSESFRRRFMGVHFFNPPRWLKLLELIPTPETDAAELERMTRFLEKSAARRVVLAKDTPGFIANRYGMWCMYWATSCAEALGLSVEEADLITGPFMGRPKSGTFRLNDLVGLDVMEDIAQNLMTRRPEDPRTSRFLEAKTVRALLAKGWLGGKSGQGYYRREGRELMALDLGTLAYRQMREASFDSIEALKREPLGSRLSKALELKDPVGEFLRRFLPPALAYAVELQAEVSHSPEDFDRVMRWGFGWEQGPFELIDSIGSAAVGLDQAPFYQCDKVRLVAGGHAPLKVEPEFAPLESYPVLDEREGLRVRDLGDGVHAVCLTTKLGVVGPPVVRALHGLLDEGALDRFVLATEGPCYSVGFDLKFFRQAILDKDDRAIAEAIESLQSLAMRFTSMRSVAALHGWSLGGGLELALGCAAIAADAEAKIGLPEAKVGLLPGGGGSAQMRSRARPDAHGVADMIVALTEGKVCENASEAMAFGFLGPNDLIVEHPDRLITDAKELAKTVEPTSRPWPEVTGPASGIAEKALKALQAKGELTDHDLLIGEKLRNILGKSDSFELALRKEREAFFSLAHEGLTLGRIAHMLETGKPLRN
jgi:3-hydroxyacyl-CoA dehydrogenase